MTLDVCASVTRSESENQGMTKQDAQWEAHKKSRIISLGQQTEKKLSAFLKRHAETHSIEL